ncbi:MAG: TlpA family protein disulfide reductase [Flavobacteriaceae bacterium]|nr:TlpA family protein disulfide reductase [Flavobacteriaceae bacterium]
MIKNLFVALMFLTFSANAQDTIRVKMEPNNGYKWMMLYKINGAKQQYVSNTDIEEGEYKLTIPKNFSAGMYRAFYDMDNGGYLDFLYNNESFSVTFNPSLPEQTAHFEKSEENKVYQSYLNAIYLQQSKIDSLQMTYFDSDKNPSIQKNYTKQLKKLYNLQDYFEKESEGKLAQEFIKITKKHYDTELLETPEAFLESLETHFFDYINFDNKILLNSTVFIDKAIEYIFYINSSEDPKIQRELREKSINDVMEKVSDNFVKSEILSSLLYAFAGQEALEMVDFIKEKHYNLLPTEYIDTKFIADIDRMLSVAIGRVAPEITWKEGNKTMRLSDLNEDEKYIVTFWSTTCSHCLKEIPELYKFTQELNSVKVIAVALEEDKFGFNHHTEMMDKWINVLALNKWENKIARSYEIHSTPSYFVLDRDKKITAKPEQLVDLLHYLGAKDELLNEISERISKE